MLNQEDKNQLKFLRDSESIEPGSALAELIALERKDAESNVSITSCDWCNTWISSVAATHKAGTVICQACINDPSDQLRALLKDSTK